MGDLEFSIDHELFRVSERTQPGGRLSYDFAWLNGPAEGTYGFTASRLTATSAGAVDPQDEERMSADDLIGEARRFLGAFYGRGGIGEEDFPHHVRARGKSDGAGD
ncbi:MAG: hypothetical protein JWM51_2045 [Microbacteriaceae bacterium]|jgi:hypothetical protein|nr:hypothetical protein [Microbacteriaceae bacterium]